MSQVVGILGGMGPAATADFYQKLIAATPAKADQDHLKVLIYSNPHIPDRTAAILRGGPDPVPALVAAAEVLVRAGADFLTIPCITAHYFYPALHSAVPIPILHIIQEAAEAALATEGCPRTLGLLATSGTLQTRLFESFFEPRGMRIIAPDSSVQEVCVMPAIYGVKHGERLDTPRRLIREAAAHLQAQGAEAVIAGCTEVPLILSSADLDVPLVDPTTILAQAAVRRALGQE